MTVPCTLYHACGSRGWVSCGTLLTGNIESACGRCQDRPTRTYARLTLACEPESQIYLNSVFGVFGFCCGWAYLPSEGLRGALRNPDQPPARDGPSRQVRPLLRLPGRRGNAPQNAGGSEGAQSGRMRARSGPVSAVQGPGPPPHTHTSTRVPFATYSRAPLMTAPNGNTPIPDSDTSLTV